MDTFDDELDKEIREEKIKLQRKEAEEIENIARENEMVMRFVGSGSSIPKKKFVGTYATHGEEFKLRKATRYVESSNESENENVLSESESDSGIGSIIDSSDEEEYDVQDRKNIRYVSFNEKSMKDIKFFPGLVFASKKQVREALSWYSILHHKPLWLATNDSKMISVKCEFPCNFSIWITKDYHIGYTDWCMKNINKTHNGCHEKKIRFCNNTFLAKALEEKFRVMPEMSLAATQVLVLLFDSFHSFLNLNLFFMYVFIDDMFHIKVSKTCARNTKGKGLKKINGD
ncbi:hypothetical protein LIER_32322 [Lithospermum erythrorhizon]|uniref:Transposase MuDR plant domain-containing protein n=1 Tax=Lithospermum erythrorhizon TaxID=34254 RepID=A0AAV3RUG8_LITER